MVRTNAHAHTDTRTHTHTHKPETPGNGRQIFGLLSRTTEGGHGRTVPRAVGAHFEFKRARVILVAIHGIWVPFENLCFS